MNAKVIHIQAKDVALLEGSIQKWERAVEYYRTKGQSGAVPRGAEDCPLCSKYNQPRQNDAPCIGCPIWKDTGLPYCRGTPHETLMRTLALKEMQEELAYLQDLLSRCVADDPLSRHDELASISDAP